MIHSICHSGSGLGNQLFRLVAGKVLALDNDMEHKFVAYENFKGKSFMNLGDIGSPLPYRTEPNSGKVIPYMPAEKMPVPVWEEKTNYYNPEFNFIVKDPKLDYFIDGEFQSEQYFNHRLPEINEWLKVEPIRVPDDTCVIGFRGGEFSVYPELFLTKDYWAEAIKLMRERGVNNFEIHTDDEPLAKEYFAIHGFPVIHNVGINWRSMRYARHAIIANSSFYILPRLLRNNGFTIAPRFWARRNIGEWSRPDNYYKSFKYI